MKKADEKTATVAKARAESTATVAKAAKDADQKVITSIALAEPAPFPDIAERPEQYRQGQTDRRQKHKYTPASTLHELLTRMYAYTVLSPVISIFESG